MKTTNPQQRLEAVRQAREAAKKRQALSTDVQCAYPANPVACPRCRIGVADAAAKQCHACTVADQATARGEVAEADACPKCGERSQDNLVWQDNGKVKCGTCGMRYRPPTR